MSAPQPVAAPEVRRLPLPHVAVLRQPGVLAVRWLADRGPLTQLTCILHAAGAAEAAVHALPVEAVMTRACAATADDARALAVIARLASAALARPSRPGLVRLESAGSVTFGLHFPALAIAPALRDVVPTGSAPTDLTVVDPLFTSAAATEARVAAFVARVTGALPVVGEPAR